MAQRQLDESNQADERPDFEEVTFGDVLVKLKEEFDETSGKPILETNTNAEIIETQLKRSITPKVDKQGKEYYDTILTIHTLLEDGRESYDNYSGLREYSDGYWNGRRSAFGRLQQLMIDEFGVKTRAEMLQKLEGQQVKLKTETTSYNGQDFKKNMIQGFR